MLNFLEGKRKKATEEEEKVDIKNCFLLMHAFFKPLSFVEDSKQPLLLPSGGC